MPRLASRDGQQPLRRAGGETLLMIADSETDSDLYYASEFLVGDPMVYIEFEGRKVLLVSDLEFGRAHEEARVDAICSTAPLEKELRAAGERPRLAALAELWLRQHDARRLVVPHNFALGHAEYLQSRGYELEIREEPFFPEREVKRDQEIEAITASQRVAEVAMENVIDEIRRAEIRDGWLWRGSEQLTVEALRRETHKLLLEHDHIAVHTIIAPGDQGCDPHVRGSGPLPAHQTIVIDIFPRSTITRYWGDMTRTVVRGEPGPAVHKLFDDVHAALDAAIGVVRDGVDGRDVHNTVVELLAERGNPTEDRDGRKVGFIHSTGHGVGLDIHEAPKLGRVTWPLKAGNTITIEPGLYYFGTGAVRLEDLVVVEQNGCRNLNRFPKTLVV